MRTVLLAHPSRLAFGERLRMRRSIFSDSATINALILRRPRAARASKDAPQGERS